MPVEQCAFLFFKSCVCPPPPPPPPPNLRLGKESKHEQNMNKPLKGYSVPFTKNTDGNFPHLACLFFSSCPRPIALPVSLWRSRGRFLWLLKYILNKWNYSLLMYLLVYPEFKFSSLLTWPTWQFTSSSFWSKLPSVDNDILVYVLDTTVNTPKWFSAFSWTFLIITSCDHKLSCTLCVCPPVTLIPRLKLPLNINSWNRYFSQNLFNCI